MFTCYIQHLQAGENRKVWKQLSEATFQQNTLRWRKLHEDPFWYCCSLVASSNWFPFTIPYAFSGEYGIAVWTWWEVVVFFLCHFISVHMKTANWSLLLYSDMVYVSSKIWETNGLQYNQCFLCQWLKITKSMVYHVSRQWYGTEEVVTKQLYSLSLIYEIYSCLISQRLAFKCFWSAFEIQGTW